MLTGLKFLMALLIVGATPLAAAPVASAFTLVNGLQVVVVPDHRVPVVTHMIWYKVGAADDPEGRSGLAHFLEHLMFKSTERIKTGEFSRIISRLGGRDNALTEHDTTSYYQRVAKRHLRAVMELEADRMVNIRLIDAEVLTERDVVREERRSKVESTPLSLLSETMLAVLYSNHPYSRPVLGWPNEIPLLTLEDARAFYTHHYAPNNAVLVVVGDVTVDEVRALVEATYGHNRNLPGIEWRRRPKEPPPRAAKRVELEDPGAGVPILVRYYHAPSLSTGATGEAETVAVLLRILGGGDTSRLYRRLVLERALAAHAGTDYQSTGLDSGRIALLAVGTSPDALGAIETAMDEVISEVRATGITEEELARAKLGLEAERVFQADNQHALATRYGQGVALGRTIDDIEAFEARLAVVTAADVKKMASRLLRIERAVTGTVVPSVSNSGLRQ